MFPHRESLIDDSEQGIMGFREQTVSRTFVVHVMVQYHRKYCCV